MKINHYEKIESRSVEMEGAVDCRVRWLIGKPDGATNFSMRQFEVAAGGHTPKHFHPYEHEIFVIEGEGVILEGDEPRPIKQGDVIYVAPDEVHQFQATGGGPLKFLCLIPNSALAQGATVVPECGG